MNQPALITDEVDGRLKVVSTVVTSLQRLVTADLWTL